MSYILEALRKAEQQRHAEPAPILVAPQQYPRPVRQIQHWKRWAVFIFMLNGAVIGVLWWYPSPWRSPSAVNPPVLQPVLQTVKPLPSGVMPVLPVAIAVEKPVLAPPPVKKIPNKPEVAPAPAPKPEPVKVVAPVVLPAVLPPQPETVAISLQPQETPMPEPVAVATPTEPETTPAYQQIPTLHELSAEFQQSLPPLPINVFVYHTNPQQRFVLIGMRKYQEGQTIQGGPVLEAITPDSLILHQAGRYFRIIRP